MDFLTRRTFKRTMGLYDLQAGTQLKTLVCLTLVLFIAGCIPIGLKSSSLPYASVTAPAK